MAKPLMIQGIVMQQSPEVWFDYVMIIILEEICRHTA
jgi:hypothetical protein